MTVTAGRSRAFRPLGWLLLCVLPATRSPASEPRPDQFSARLVRVEAIIERTLTSTPIPLSPEVKSFLVPGWGQLSQGRPVPGLVFGASAAAAITSVVVFAVRGSRAYNRYQDAETPEDAVYFRAQTVDADRRRNISIAAGAFVWGLNVLDAALAERRARKKP